MVLIVAQQRSPRPGAEQAEIETPGRHVAETQLPHEPVEHTGSDPSIRRFVARLTGGDDNLRPGREVQLEHVPHMDRRVLAVRRHDDGRIGRQAQAAPYRVHLAEIPTELDHADVGRMCLEQRPQNLVGPVARAILHEHDLPASAFNGLQDIAAHRRLDFPQILLIEVDGDHDRVVRNPGLHTPPLASVVVVCVHRGGWLRRPHSVDASPSHRRNSRLRPRRGRAGTPT